MTAMLSHHRSSVTRDPLSRGEGIVDESLLVQMDGATITPVHGERANIKVTVPEDVEIVTAVLQHRTAGARLATANITPR